MSAESLERILRLDRRLAGLAVKRIEEYWGRYKSLSGVNRLKIMDFCGTHEYSITRYGLRALMPNGIELVAGPGCPVCVTPSHYIEESIKLALDGVVVYTYGDVYRVRAYRSVRGAFSLSEARSLGGDVRVTTDILAAARDAARHGKPSVFIGIGFETVAPGYAQAILRRHLPGNLKLLSLVKLTPPAMFYTLDVTREKPTEPPIMGVIAPGHVSTITGAKAWLPVSENYGIPVVVSGFEPLDVLVSILEILRQLVEGKPEVTVEYRRAVSWHGDIVAQRNISRVFTVVDDAWRGVGFLPKSGLRVRDAFREIDAFHEYGVRELAPGEWSRDTPPACRCAEVVLGKAYPSQCPLFLKACTPARPVGPCMVSDEGTCSIWARYGSSELIGRIADFIQKSGEG
ncbi:MAG: hydrogenase formation protein HypD [Desulfurococcus sp.]|nr:hydrogenase formation protein HypD [Desulfurococcus sp.]